MSPGWAFWATCAPSAKDIAGISVIANAAAADAQRQTWLWISWRVLSMGEPPLMSLMNEGQTPCHLQKTQ
ncbi:hypothetical protein GCM10011408_10060 [Dyella caseinilytica]|nr:hypothetical protein GCM10011408_10060 [Dyella caseinilytica]